MEFSGERQTITVVIELTVAVGIAPGVFVNATIAVVIVADVVVGEGDDLNLHRRYGVRHPLSSVVVADDHHVMTVLVVAVIADEGVVIATLDIARDFQPR